MSLIDKLIIGEKLIQELIFSYKIMDLRQTCNRMFLAGIHSGMTQRGI